MSINCLCNNWSPWKKYLLNHGNVDTGQIMLETFHLTVHIPQLHHLCLSPAKRVSPRSSFHCTYLNNINSQQLQLFMLFGKRSNGGLYMLCGLSTQLHLWSFRQWWVGTHCSRTHRVTSGLPLHTFSRDTFTEQPIREDERPGELGTNCSRPGLSLDLQLHS